MSDGGLGARFAQLSAREKDVLRLMAKGLTNREIAQRLFISPHTVKNHVSHIYQKIGMDDRTKVALWAIRTGVVPLEGESKAQGGAEEPEDHPADEEDLGAGGGGLGEGTGRPRRQDEGN